MKIQPKLLGLIAGNGRFPILFAQKAKTQNFKVIAAGIKGDTNPVLKLFVDQGYELLDERPELYTMMEKDVVDKKWVQLV